MLVSSTTLSDSQAMTQYCTLLCKPYISDWLQPPVCMASWMNIIPVLLFLHTRKDKESNDLGLDLQL